MRTCLLRLTWTRRRCTQTNTTRLQDLTRHREGTTTPQNSRRNDRFLFTFSKVDALAKEQPNTHPSSLPLTSPFRPNSLTSTWNPATVDLDRGWPPLLGVADAARRRWSRWTPCTTINGGSECDAQCATIYPASSSAAPRRRIPNSPPQFFLFDNHQSRPVFVHAPRKISW